MNLRRPILQTFSIARADFLGLARNRTALFFTLVFPLFFLVIVGFTFGSQGSGETSRIHVGVVNLDGGVVDVNGTASENSGIGDALVQALRDANFTVHEYPIYGDVGENGTAANGISSGSIKIAVIVPTNFTEVLSLQYRDELGIPLPIKARLDIYTDPSDPTGPLIAQQSVLGFITGFTRYYQEVAVGHMPLAYHGYIKFLADPINISTHEANVSGRRLRWIDYMVPGTLGLVLIWSGLNHASMTIANERDRGTFQRIVIAPVSPLTVLAGKLISCLAIVYISALIMLSSGVLLFRVNLYWNLPVIVLLTFLGSLTSIGLGLIISSLAKNGEAANAVTVVVSVPLQFFIGAFFPLSIMPEPAQIFGEALPYTKFVSAMQGVMTKNLSLQSVVPDVLYIAVSGATLFIVGVLTYWWSLKRL